MSAPRSLIASKAVHHGLPFRSRPDHGHNDDEAEGEDSSVSGNTADAREMTATRAIIWSADQSQAQDAPRRGARTGIIWVLGS